MGQKRPRCQISVQNSVQNSVHVWTHSSTKIRNWPNVKIELRLQRERFGGLPSGSPSPVVTTKTSPKTSPCSWSRFRVLAPRLNLAEKGRGARTSSVTSPSFGQKQPRCQNESWHLALIWSKTAEVPGHVLAPRPNWVKIGRGARIQYKIQYKIQYTLGPILRLKSEIGQM